MNHHHSSSDDTRGLKKDATGSMGHLKKLRRAAKSPSRGDAKENGQGEEKVWFESVHFCKNGIKNSIPVSVADLSKTFCSEEAVG